MCPIQRPLLSHSSIRLIRTFGVSMWHASHGSLLPDCIWTSGCTAKTTCKPGQSPEFVPPQQAVIHMASISFPRFSHDLRPPIYHLWPIIATPSPTQHCRNSAAAPSGHWLVFRGSYAAGKLSAASFFLVPPALEIHLDSRRFDHTRCPIRQLLSWF